MPKKKYTEVDFVSLEYVDGSSQSLVEALGGGTYLDDEGYALEIARVCVSLYDCTDW